MYRTAHHRDGHTFVFQTDSRAEYLRYLADWCAAQHGITDLKAALAFDRIDGTRRLHLLYVVDAGKSLYRLSQEIRSLWTDNKAAGIESVLNTVHPQGGHPENELAVSCDLDPTEDLGTIKLCPKTPAKKVTDTP